jgi:hypothetical protein
VWSNIPREQASDSGAEFRELGRSGIGWNSGIERNRRELHGTRSLSSWLIENGIPELDGPDSGGGTDSGGETDSGMCNIAE